MLGKLIIYFACAGQQKAAPLGYSPLPPNLVQAVFAAVKRIPGAPAHAGADADGVPQPDDHRAGLRRIAGQRRVVEPAGHDHGDDHLDRERLRRDEDDNDDRRQGPRRARVTDRRPGGVGPAGGHAFGGSSSRRRSTPA